MALKWIRLYGRADYCGSVRRPQMEAKVVMRPPPTRPPALISDKITCWHVLGIPIPTITVYRAFVLLAKWRQIQSLRLTWQTGTDVQIRPTPWTTSWRCWWRTEVRFFFLFNSINFSRSFSSKRELVVKMKVASWQDASIAASLTVDLPQHPNHMTELCALLRIVCHVPIVINYKLL